MVFLIILLVLTAIAAAAFAVWFITYKNSGKCPLCALQKLRRPTRVTMDIENEPQYSDSCALTPPMGWSSWNTFRQNISEELVLSTAEAVKNSGLLDAGYQYINFDDCWHSSLRDENGRLQGDLERFPRGIQPVIQEINRMGMKVGLYSSNGTLTCEDLPASLGREELDAETIASWGCEYFKYDFCHHKVISGEAPVIEALAISRPGEKAQLTLYPEDAELSGRARIMNIKKLPSGKGIGMLNHGAGRAVFRPTVNSAGKYVLTVMYYKQLATREQYLQFIINGKVFEVFFPTAKGFTPTGRAQAIIELREGENEMIVMNPVVTPADSSYIQYSRMGRALKEAAHKAAVEKGTREKPIVFSICEWGMAFPWHWGSRAGNLWRTTPDISANWKSIHMIYSHNIRLYRHARPGAWNDPDMLEVGNGKLSENENKTHFSLWCMMAAPLILGNDVRTFVSADGTPAENNSVLKTVTNKELIAIDQDALGKPAKRIKKVRGVDIIARPLEGGDIAVCFYNPSSGVKGFSLDLGEITADEYLEMPQQPSYQLHELWSGERFSAKTVSASLQKHESRIYRISRG